MTYSDCGCVFIIFYILLSTRFQTRRMRRVRNAKDDGIQEVARRVRDILFYKSRNDGFIHGVLQRLKHMIASH